MVREVLAQRRAEELAKKERAMAKLERAVQKSPEGEARPNCAKPEAGRIMKGPPIPRAGAAVVHGTANCKGMVGLKNQGTTCFMNCYLQVALPSALLRCILRLWRSN